MVILDTDVLSALMTPAPNEAVLAWFDGQSRLSIWTTSITVLEVRFGIEILPAGKKRAVLGQSFERIIQQSLEHRIAEFGFAAAQETASLMAKRRVEGRPSQLRDSMIAGIAIAHRAALATRNTRHFLDLPVPVVDPWKSASRH
jgi:predicted nucleic acid-binding protein